MWSGGTEGVISPHMTVISRDDSVASDADWRRRTRRQRPKDAPIAPEEVGTLTEIDVVADATRRAMTDLSIRDPADVHYVQIKGPLLTPAAIADAAARGARVVTNDPNASKSFARGATALGVAVALGRGQSGRHHRRANHERRQSLFEGRGDVRRWGGNCVRGRPVRQQPSSGTRVSDRPRDAARRCRHRVCGGLPALGRTVLRGRCRPDEDRSACRGGLRQGAR